MKVKMMLGLWLVLSVGLTSCASQRSGGGNTQVDVPVYRGVDANNNNGRATLSPSQFKFNLELSTFAAPAQAPVQKACNYRFTVTGVANPVVPGVSGQVQGLAGYVATFDDSPPGHWGITQPVGTSTLAAAQAVAVFAQGNRGNVVNGTRNDCN